MTRVDKTDISRVIVGVGAQNVSPPGQFFKNHAMGNIWYGGGDRKEKGKQTRPSATSMSRLRRRNVRSSMHSSHGTKQCSD
eukprot:14184891-Ditylum_brightwellii.AAC.1